MPRIKLPPRIDALVKASRALADTHTAMLVDSGAKDEAFDVVDAVNQAILGVTLAYEIKDDG
jgi:hypothetical protein